MQADCWQASGGERHTLGWSGAGCYEDYLNGKTQGLASAQQRPFPPGGGLIPRHPLSALLPPVLPVVRPQVLSSGASWGRGAGHCSLSCSGFLSQSRGRAQGGVTLTLTWLVSVTSQVAMGQLLSAMLMWSRAVWEGRGSEVSLLGVPSLFPHEVTEANGYWLHLFWNCREAE